MHLTLLLPARSRLGGAPLSPSSARLLGRGERLPDATPGRQAQLRRYFDLPEGHWIHGHETRDTRSATLYEHLVI